MMMFCLKHKIIKISTISQIIEQKMQCKLCSSVFVGNKARRDIEELGSKFIDNKGNFSLKRYRNTPDKFLYTCYDCKEDDYTIYGGCKYEWLIGYSSLKSGEKPCRCVSTENSRLDTKEIEHKIKTICERDSLKFAGWLTNYKNYKSKFLWNCDKGHECKTSVNKFVVQGQRCKTYANINRKTSWSFQEENKGKTDYLYFLNLYNEDENFIKIGRTVDPKRRFKEYTCKYSLQVIKVFEGLYEDIWFKEKYIHDRNKGLNYQPRLYTAGFSQECYTVDILNEDFTQVTEDFKDNTYKFLYLNKERK